MYQVFAEKEATAMRSSAMETGDHFKNVASPKSLMSRGNIMKRTFLLFAFFWISVASSFAQDIITLKNGEDIQGLVLEIGIDDVKYKKFENPNGPSYTLKKSDVLMIRYFNGNTDVFADSPTPAVTTTPAPVIEQPRIQNNKGEVYYNFWGTLKYRSDKTKVKNMEDLFYDMPEASKIHRSGKTWYAVGSGIWAGGFLIILYDNISHWDDYNHKLYSGPTFWTGLGIAIVGIPFMGVGTAKIGTAIDMYNSSVRRQHTSDISLNFGITRSGGIGLTLNF